MWSDIEKKEQRTKIFLIIVGPQYTPHSCLFNTLRPRQNGHCFADDTFKRIFFNENVRISIKISLKFVPYGTVNNIPALVQIMAGRRLGDKPLSEPMMVSLLTHICVTRPQWDNILVTVNRDNYNLCIFVYIADDAKCDLCRCHFLMVLEIIQLYWLYGVYSHVILYGWGEYANTASTSWENMERLCMIFIRFSSKQPSECVKLGCVIIKRHHIIYCDQ